MVSMVSYGFVGKEQTLKLEIGAVDLKDIPDGIYNGIYDCYRWTNEVAVTVKNQKIIGVTIIKTQSGRESLDRKLIDRIINEQKTDLDGISGATADSKAFLKAVDNALNKPK
jgi:uncharacterized protein with FMN-binding domain